MKTLSLFLLLAFCCPAQADTYVLVHGAWGGGWAWKAVDQLLTQRGHTVYRPTLTGLGEKRHLIAPNVNLSTHIDDVANLILFENLRDVVLVGHSYGGGVVTGVLDRLPDRIKRIVYLDAHLPQSGESLYDAMLPARRETLMKQQKDDLLIPDWVKPGTPPPHDVPHPAATLRQKLTLTNPLRLNVPGLYILTADDATKPEADPFFYAYNRAKTLRYTVVVMPADHNPQRTQPTELVKRLIGE
jgi:pimeloyl-ACP methyl ester carboxylesterase